MSGFLRNAKNILEAAQGAGPDASDMTILIGAEGEIRMIAGNDWPLEALQRHQGAAMAYRVSRKSGHVTVEGTAAGQSCRLQTDAPGSMLRRVLGTSALCAPAAIQTHLECEPPAPEDQTEP